MVILIADDDRLVRFTVKSMLGEILGDMGNVYFEAANGRDMVKICEERKPDVAFVDIKMPYLDGLDAIAQSKEYSKATEYVLISGYSDFEYAQRGIRLGVNEYLLKPVDEEQLRRVVEKLKEKLKVRKRESNSRFQLRVMEAFSDHSVTTPQEPEPHGLETEYRYLGFVVYVRANLQDKEASRGFQQELMKDIQSLGEEMVARKGYYGIASTGEGFPCVVFWGNEEMKAYILSAMRKKLVTMSGKNTEIFRYILWFEKRTLEEVRRTCEEMDLEIYKGMNYCSGDLYAYGEAGIDKKNGEFLRLVEQLMDAWEMEDGMACNEIMNKIWRSYKDEALNVNLKNISRYCGMITGGDIAGDSLKAFCTSLVKQSDQMYGKAAGEENDMMEQVKKYIQKYYMNDISISQIAEHFGLTANYLSTVFHRKTGGKFIDYLTSVRMEAAKRLLIQNASASVQDIALLVGYNSARHFSTLFQKTTGETPSAYRKTRV